MADGLDNYTGGFSSYRVFVDYTQSIEDALSEGGYDWVDKRINSGNFESVFKHEGKKELRLYLVKFQQGVFTKEVIHEFREELLLRNMYPATLWDALALSAKYPHLHEDHSIVALASPWQDPQGRDHVPVLKRDERGRSVRLDKAYFPWRKECRFLASLVK